mmetsp:Transcript_122776/g.382240  ORF Transcript_122776/g.382240 Transcript_122776/m.382240 type:complete len:207 (-) Transcript_122776:33-653(-)
MRPKQRQSTRLTYGKEWPPDPTGVVKDSSKSMMFCTPAVASITLPATSETVPETSDTLPKTSWILSKALFVLLLPVTEPTTLPTTPEMSLAVPVTLPMVVPTPLTALPMSVVASTTLFAPPRTFFTRSSPNHLSVSCAGVALLATRARMPSATRRAGGSSDHGDTPKGAGGRETSDIRCKLLVLRASTRRLFHGQSRRVIASGMIR